MGSRRVGRDWVTFTKKKPPNNSLTSFRRTGTISRQKAPQSLTLTILLWGLLESIFYSLPQSILSKNSLPMYHSTAISSIKKKEEKHKAELKIQINIKFSHLPELRVVGNFYKFVFSLWVYFCVNNKIFPNTLSTLDPHPLSHSISASPSVLINHKLAMNPVSSFFIFSTVFFILYHKCFHSFFFCKELLVLPLILEHPVFPARWGWTRRQLYLPEASPCWLWSVNLLQPPDLVEGMLSPRYVLTSPCYNSTSWSLITDS